MIKMYCSLLTVWSFVKKSSIIYEPWSLISTDVLIKQPFQKHKGTSKLEGFERMTLTSGNWKILSSILAWGVLRLGISLQQDLPTKRTKWRPEERRKEFLKKPECPERQRVLQAWTVEGNEGNLQNQLHGVFVHWSSGGGMHIAFFLGSCDAWPWKVHLLGPSKEEIISCALLLFVLTLQSMKGCSCGPRHSRAAWDKKSSQGHYHEFTCWLWVKDGVEVASFPVSLL